MILSLLVNNEPLVITNSLTCHLYALLCVNLFLHVCLMTLLYDNRKAKKFHFLSLSSTALALLTAPLCLLS